MSQELPIYFWLPACLLGAFVSTWFLVFAWPRLFCLLARRHALIPKRIEGVGWVEFCVRCEATGPRYVRRVK